MVNYPGSLDTSTSLPRAVDGTTPVSSSQYNQTRDAVIAIENELGVLPSSIHGTVRNRLDYIESYIIAGGGVQLAQDLGGLATAPLVIGLYGNPILSTSPTLNYVLTWNGLAWEPKAPSISGGDHNTLGTLQGGTTNQYYHLTSAQHVWLTAGVTTGYWDETKGGTGLTSYATGDVLYADGTNSLGKLTIGSDGYVMRVTSGLPYWDSPSWTVLEGGTGISTVTTGDILYASASDTLSRLSAASDGYVLTMSGGVPVWSSDSSPTSHNALTGIQGGSGTDGYYHFTSYEHTWLQDGYATGYWNVIKGGTGVTSYTTGDILYASAANTLSKLPSTVDGYVLSLSGGVPAWTGLPAGFVAGGDLSGTSISQNVIKIQNRDVADTAVLPRAGQQLTWSTANNRWEYAFAPTSGPEQHKAGQIGIKSDFFVGANPSTFTDIGQVDNSNRITCATYLGNGIILIGFNYSNVSSDQDAAIYKSTDYGVTWTKKYDKSYDGMSRIFSFGNLGNGVILAYSNAYIGIWHTYILRSTDYGETWSIYVTDPVGGQYISEFAKCDGNVIVGASYNDAAVTGGIMRSTDNGATWSLVVTRGYQETMNCATYLGNGIVLVGGDAGYGSINLYRSTDNGVTWTSTTAYDTWNTTVTPNIPKHSDSADVNQLIDLGGGMVLAVLDLSMSLSMDYGLTWTPTHLPGESTQGGSTAYLGNGRLIMNKTTDTALTTGGEIFHSIDYGRSWKSYGTLIPSNRRAFILINCDGDLVAGHHQGYVSRLANVGAVIPQGTKQGGTGLSSYATGDLLYASGTNILSKLSASTDGYVLSLSGGIPAWTASSGGTSDHNALTNLQGGEADGYYHLTQDQHTWLTDGYADGYWNEIKGGTGQISYITGDILYASGANTLSKLGIGTSNQVLQISGGVPTWQTLSGTLLETPTENVGGGTGALDSITTGDYNTAFGYNAGTGVSSGYNNTLIGRSAASSLTTGYSNIVVGGGLDVAGSLSSGNSNTIIGGANTGDSLTSREKNTFIGLSAGQNCNSNYNTYVGAYTGVADSSNSPTAFSNSAFGANALSGSTQSNISECTAIGVSALSNLTYFIVQRSTALGYGAASGTSANDSVAVGYGAGSSALGAGSIAIGSSAVGNSSSEYTISIGYSPSATQDGAIAIGYNADATHTQSLVIGYDSSSVASKGNNTAVLDYHSLYLGRDTNENITIYAHRATDPLPYIRYSNSGSKWIGSNDGTTTFDLESSTGISDHNLLTNLQGGEADGYYHLTPTQHTWLTDGYADGYWGISKGGTGITSYTPGDMLAADISGNLEKINGNPGETVITNSSGLMVFTDLTIDYITGGLTGELPASTDGYFLNDLSITSDENMVTYVVNTETATIKNLYVTCSNKPSTGNVVITVRKNTVDTAMTVTLNNASTSRNSKYYEEDLSNTFDVSRGDFISVRFVSDSGASPNDVQISIEVVKKVSA